MFICLRFLQFFHDMVPIIKTCFTELISVHLIFTLVTQTSALDALKSANPDGQFWIKLDATDLRVAVMESGRHVWNGDVALSFI